ncbi:hypothetical protein MTER_18860 [Mycolicibacter terrae]|uniref:DUF5666 domain-containing protein n=1 Tax=Mycolicibacter terrae TaxID=1788 RepID=A0AAD1HXV2_9MYCO|nr:DUF5666 domain-containing protein [Mycolicibacter terrae]ORW96851.1 hypothetical protein AWC28_09785 [Mycolicibacter terrae]BBX22475.1 hypothetical protein MTER_18860 [Mycolicibacter terrae]SNV75058.1 27 kDa lipoprotein antigen [Mycolicibacter terrae]
MSALPSTAAPALCTLTGAAALFAAALFVPASAHAEGDRVIGPVSSVTGSTFEVARPAGSATVAFSDSTRIVEPVPAQLGEITAGTCIKAGAAPGSAPADSGAITAKWVAISTPIDGKCPQRPAAAADAPAPPAPHRGVRGVVDSVAGDTITVTGANGQTTVTVNDDTHLRRMVTVGAGVISDGKCVAARGEKDGNGVLQATRISVWAPDGDACPEPAM